MQAPDATSILAFAPQETAYTEASCVATWACGVAIEHAKARNTPRLAIGEVTLKY